MEFINCFGHDDDKEANSKKKKNCKYNSEKEKECQQHNKDNGAKKFKGKKKEDSAITQKINNVKLDTEKVKILEYKEYNEEIDYGNVEYKLKLNGSMIEKRMEKLATQMNFRLTEGNGECFYEIGVEDNGNPLGLSKEDLEESLKVLYLITEKIGAKMSIMNYRDGKTGLIGEIMIVRDEPIKNKLKVEIKIGLIGEEKSGKSTLVGVLVTDKLDNGSGLASKNVFRHKHEVICGKTSSFTHQIVGFDEEGKMTNHSFFGKLSWPQIVDRSSKIVNFYDLGGSERALKSSIKSLSPSYLDYLALVVSASEGITKYTIVFLKLALAMDLPVMIIITKIDLLDEDDQFELLKKLNYVVKNNNCKRILLKVKNQEDVVMFARMMKECIIPVFCVSNTLGKGLDNFINFLNILPANIPNIEEDDKNIQFDILSILTLENKALENKINKVENQFDKFSTDDYNLYTKDLSVEHKIKMNESINVIKENINDKFTESFKKIDLEDDINIISSKVNMTCQTSRNTINTNNPLIETSQKVILVGIVSQGSIEKNCQLQLGPDNNGKFKKVSVKAIHCKRIEVYKAYRGQFCTLEVDIKENEVRKGMVLVDCKLTQQACKVFEADIWNISDKEIKFCPSKTQLTISCGHIRQKGLLLKLSNDKDSQEEIIIKPDETKTIIFEFCFNPEFIKEGRHLLILENSFKCYGIVKKLLK